MFIYVLRGFRGKGIEQKLIKAFIERIKMISNIEQNNPTAIAAKKDKALYKKLVFKLSAYSKMNKVEGKYFTEAQMILRLNDLC